MYVAREPTRRGGIPLGKYPTADPLRTPSANRRIHLRDPVGRGKNVIVHKCNDRAAGLLDPSIPSATQSLRGLKNVAHWMAERFANASTTSAVWSWELLSTTMISHLVEQGTSWAARASSAPARREARW